MMSFKQVYKGLTLIEILLSLIIVSTIFLYIIQQQLKISHEKSLDKTVAQMNVLVLAARNYYQDQLPTANNNAAAWPQTLPQLTNSNYLPKSALCSPWPTDPSTTPNKAANSNLDCGNHQEYAIFPADSNGIYDTTLPGITRTTSLNAGLTITNTGGGFWGVSLNLPSVDDAREVQQRLPFATLCTPAALITQLKNGNTSPCNTESTTVTVLVPRPATWPSDKQYAKDGLIQTIGTVVICNSLNPASRPCNSRNNTVTIPIPTSCGNDENGKPLIPALFIYPFDYDFNSNAWLIFNKASGDYTGIGIKVVRNASTWTVASGMSGTGNNDPSKLQALVLAYFTVCAPYNTQSTISGGIRTTNWDASYFGPGAAR